MAELVQVHKDKQTAILTIQREDKHNALSIEVLDQLIEDVEGIRADPDCQIMILTGSGTKAFSAGADIAQMSEMELSSSLQFASRGHRLMNGIEGSDLVTIAAINGIAFGGGLELALACDIRIASEKALFALPETKIGLVPGFGGTQRLREQLGKARALEMILTGDPIGAAQAYEWGLVNHVVKQAKVIETARDVAQRVSKTAPLARSRARNLILAGESLPRNVALGEESETFSELISGEEAQTGLQAFLDKRDPQF